MRLNCMIHCALVGTTLADADFNSVRRRLHKDMSGRGGDPPGKYFRELPVDDPFEDIDNGLIRYLRRIYVSSFHPHYDGRYVLSFGFWLVPSANLPSFADRVLEYSEQKRALKSLIQTYLSTFADIGVETWLMHGSLLGWWWNRQIMPWDSDIDVQVLEPGMYYLAAYYNMSVFHYKTPRLPDGRDYLLEVNPHYTNRDRSDWLNVIDARWIDTETGLFIDITTARYDPSHSAGEGVLTSKDGHEYRDTYLYPLRDTMFEGAPAKIPYRFREILEAEYGASALVNKDFHDHEFDDEKMEWVPKMMMNKNS
ncbi:mannosylphosphorylation protein [Sporothrix schenckii 1099-18]|uniref:Mannosylphosphorylation protein n=1 Tax=Sporothrix schenckii 1099-18 TaxID=1397361 RepID=A0A0F2LVG2_SPOSC|nr:mannosylphosphorylation protein [Sporothrix schenckii 1099-18]KJR80475.1 mannosylphosphorylation protein [Sporothrix schenckii 1099-18]